MFAFWYLDCLENNVSWHKFEGIRLWNTIEVCEKGLSVCVCVISIWIATNNP